MSERVLEWLGSREETIAQLVERIDILESRCAALSDRMDQASGRPPEPSPDGQRDAQAAAGPIPSPDVPSGSRWRDTVSGLVPGQLSRTPRACAVCRRGAPTRSRRDLAAQAWAVAGESAICPDCRSMGWGLRDGGGLPFRHRAAGTS